MSRRGSALGGGPGPLLSLDAVTVLSLTPAWPWALGYLVMAACFAVAPWVTFPVDDASAGH